jgi:hypothetical protein
MKNICPICNQPFEAIRNGKIYCSDRCRKQAFLERQSSETADAEMINGNESTHKNAAANENGRDSSTTRTLISNETKNKTVPLNVGELTSIIKNTVRDAMQETLQAILNNKKTERIAEDGNGTPDKERNGGGTQNEKENDNDGDNDNEIINDSDNGTDAENGSLYEKEENVETNEESEDEHSDETFQEELTDEENDKQSGTEDENDRDDENGRDDDNNGTAEHQAENESSYISKPSSAVTDKISETKANENSQLKNKIGVNDSSERKDEGSGNGSNEDGKSNGTLQQNDSRKESFTHSSTGTLFENDRNDIKENGILPGTLMQDAGESKERNGIGNTAKEEKYQNVRSVFLDSIGDIVNGTELKEKFSFPKKHFPLEKVQAVKNFTTHYRCLIENTLRLSQYSSIASEDLHFLIKGYDYLLNQPQLMEIAEICGYEEVVSALHDELCKIYRRHRGKNYLRLVLSRQWKIDAIAMLHEIGESVPLYSFKKLFGNILQGEKSF